MSFLTRTALAAVALVAVAAAAQAQTPQQPMPNMMGQGMFMMGLPDGNTMGTYGMRPMGPGMMGPGMMGSGMMEMHGSQPGGMPMHMQWQMPQVGPMNMAVDHVEGRIAFLKAELGIAPAQEPQWTSFADALRQTAEQHRALHGQMMADTANASWPERLNRHAAAMASRAEALKTLAGAAEPLYGVLDDQQKAMADRLLSGPMGMM